MRPPRLVMAEMDKVAQRSAADSEASSSAAEELAAQAKEFNRFELIQAAGKGTAVDAPLRHGQSRPSLRQII